jgi:spermidine synthase
MWDLIAKGLSYLVEIPVETRNSDHSPKLKVTLKRGRYALSTNNVYYSHEDKYSSFKRAFAQLKPTQADTNKVLVLGYGLGSIPHILHKHYHIKAHYTAVEIDPVVVGMAQRYGNLPQGSVVHWINADAISFITYTQEQFDWICVDVFVDDVIPEAFLKAEFLRETLRLLKPKGKILFSHLSTTPDKQAKVRTYFETIFKAAVPNASLIDTQGNWVLVGEKGE